MTRLVLVVLALWLVACGSQTPSAPSPPPPVSQPSQPANPFTLLNVTLSGVVFEETPTGRSPIDGVRVYCEPCGAESHTWTSTNADGVYSFTGVWTSSSRFLPTSIFVKKDGYADPPGLPIPTAPNPTEPGYREVAVNGDTQFDIRLVRQ